MSGMVRMAETAIVGAAVDAALAAGKRITVSLERGYDAEDGALLASRDRAAIMAEAFSGDEAHLFIHAADGPAVVDGALDCDGWVYLVFGNDGFDVISDYTINLDAMLAPALALAEMYA